MPGSKTTQGRTGTRFIVPIRVAFGLRPTLEFIYQQRLTFKGETGRSPSGPFIEGEVDVEPALGDVAGVRIDKLTEGPFGISGNLVKSFSLARFADEP